ncbi:YggS family pyridoxal phosphate-dependent enzyme [Marinobacterium arenosum]|uniref:YggS family pyridoxal phosphate-dependent enzyme n=1 Tax=Marinobacterium arenosum TaxID=2862496 RepID=UPI001C956582|nr:YggS family pyridoxal phosphate-dependent enzyme [Marinobacterium arenosum]MBY4676414.1 YggS family pyridoxal phosphate-dependent enzyme [Marinobacterium arenosum]
MGSIAENIASVRESLAKSAAAAGRPVDGVTLMAVSKTRHADELRAVAAEGIRDFGENYLQESLDKIEALADMPLVWHFIGPIQSNKTRPIAEHFDWVHSVDRDKIGRRLAEQRPAGMAPLNICLQVNISGEQSKSGCLPEQLPALAEALDGLPNLRLRGLMAIPQATDDERAQRAVFARMRALLSELQQEHPQMDTLSMGMSGDMAAAIAEGSTLVRIGTAIFGPRDYSQKS